MLSDKELKKIKKALDSDTVLAMDAMSPTELEKTIVEAEQGMSTAKSELQANTQYLAAKSVLKDLNGGLKDVNKRQRAKIAYALLVLESKGKV